jgi:hypothetical protein
LPFTPRQTYTARPSRRTRERAILSCAFGLALARQNTDRNRPRSWLARQSGHRIVRRVESRYNDGLPRACRRCGRGKPRFSRYRIEGESFDAHDFGQSSFHYQAAGWTRTRTGVN